MSHDPSDLSENTAAAPHPRVSDPSSGIRSGPLTGVRVLEMSGLGPVAFCCMHLADMGAEIVRVSAPSRQGADHVGYDGDPLQRGRSPLYCDLKASGAVAALLGVVESCDMLLEGYRPGVMERLGLGPGACLECNPRLVYGRVSGWGQEGPLSLAPGHDPNYLAIAGGLHPIGFRDRPPVQPLNLVADLGGGAMYLLAGVLAALACVRDGGPGQVVDAAMVDGVASLMSWVYGARAAGNWSNTRQDNVMDGGCPYSSVYETADGRYVVVAAVEPRFYSALLSALGLDAEAIPSRDDRDSWPALRATMAAVFRTRTRAEWVLDLEGSEACVSPVLDLDEAPSHPHLKARGTFITTPSGAIPAPAPRFTETPSSLAPAEAGAASGVLAGWGVDPGIVARLSGPEGSTP